MSKKNVDDNPFADVRTIAKSAHELLDNYASTLDDIKKVEGLDPAKGQRLEELSQLIDRDTKEFRDQLNEIGKIHEKWPEAPKRRSHYSEAYSNQVFSAGSKYVEAIDNINNAMMPNVLEVNEILTNTHNS